jgi:hypothetical protein
MTQKVSSRVKSDFVSRRFTRPTIDLLIQKLKAGNVSLQFKALGGEMNKFQSIDLPFADRNGTIFHIKYQVNLNMKLPNSNKQTINNFRLFRNSLKPYINGRHYQVLNFLSIGLS